MHKILSEILRKQHGITSLYPYQREVLSYLNDTKKPVATSMSGGASDLIVYCPTGYGKTLAYVIPILNYLLTTSRNDGTCSGKYQRPDGLAALIIVPTKELAAQVSEVIESFLDGMNEDGVKKGRRSFTLVTLAALKSVYEERVELQEKQPDVVVSVASRLPSHCLQTTSAQWGNSYLWECLRYLVVDEADRLLSNSYDGWVTAVRSITDKADRLRGTKSDNIVKVKEDVLQMYWKAAARPSASSGVESQSLPVITVYPMTLQKLIYTATDVKSFKGIASLRLLDPLCIRAQLDIDLLNQFLVVTKRPVEHLVETVLRTCGGKRFKAIIFCPAVTKVRQIYKLLVLQATQAGLDPKQVTTLTGDTSTRRRLEVMAHFRKNESRILVSTDLTARGINILDITHVYHCGLPHNPDVYIHRIGRTARCGNKGESHLFTNQPNKLASFQDEIKKIRPTSNIQIVETQPTMTNAQELKKRTRVQSEHF